MDSTHASGRESARDIAVWDPLVRLIHWSVALTILLNGAFIDEESTLHEWIGYIAIGLVALRLIWAVVGPGPARFTAFPPNALRALRYLRAVASGDRTIHLSHNPIGALMVYNLWGTVLILGLTGYMMTTLAYFGVDWVKEAHEIAFAWLMLSVGLHVAGVVFDSWRSGVNLVRAMLTGHKAIPAGRDVE
jgi:cytochrome b